MSTAAKKDVALQLSRAGIRLAPVLNKALGTQLASSPLDGVLGIGAVSLNQPRGEIGHGY